MNVLVIARHRRMEKTAYFTDRVQTPLLGEGMTLLIEGVDKLWMAGESLLHLAIFSRCCVVDLLISELIVLSLWRILCHWVGSAALS